jgi:hypothetical protein
MIIVAKIIKALSFYVAVEVNIMVLLLRPLLQQHLAHFSLRRSATGCSGLCLEPTVCLWFITTPNI